MREPPFAQWKGKENLSETGENKERVLLIDDDKALCGLLAEYLDSEGFEVEVVHNGADGLERALSGENHIVVLDVMMPKMNGFEVLRRLRSASRVPVLMLTARGDSVDRIVGFEVGADDYLPKPCDPRELVVRLRAILRRTNIAHEESIKTTTNEKTIKRIKVGDVELETGTRLVKRDNEVVDLTSVEYEMLLLLLESAGRIVGRETLVRAVLGRDLSPFDRSVDIHISHLRKKLGHYIGEVERIKTVRGVGYIYAVLSAE